MLIESQISANFRDFFYEKYLFIHHRGGHSKKIIPIISAIISNSVLIMHEPKKFVIISFCRLTIHQIWHAKS
jgi:hypothetical protein